MNDSQQNRIRARCESLRQEWELHCHNADQLRLKLVGMKDRKLRYSLKQDLSYAEKEMERLNGELARFEQSLPARENTAGRQAATNLGPESAKNAPHMMRQSTSERYETSPVDLDLRVKIEQRDGKTALHYVLHAPTGKVDFYHQEIPGPTIMGSPEGYQASLLQTIERLHQGLGIDGSQLLFEEIASELEGLGHELYHELFPTELRAAYREFRGNIQTLQITSDEPWIPWELVKPYDDGDRSEIIDDDFLCCQFKLTRWLSGGKAPPAAIGVAGLACIEAGTPPGVAGLPHAAKELELLTEWAKRHPGIESHPVPAATFDSVKELLKRGGTGLLHFVGHGKLVPGQPNESGFLLTDNRTLRPRNLHGRIRTRLREDRPLVFFNACQMAQQGWSLTGLGGWADRWVRHCGCGAFIGPQWTVDDELAHTFAKTFYGALGRGETFGRAAQAARRQVRKEQPGRPTWLAFVVYAHPNGRLTT